MKQVFTVTITEVGQRLGLEPLEDVILDGNNGDSLNVVDGALLFKYHESAEGDAPNVVMYAPGVWANVTSYIESE